MKKNNFIFYTTLISFTIFSLIIFFIYYNSSEKSSLRGLKEISIKINKINDNLDSLIKDYAIDTNNTKKYLIESINNLNTLSNSIPNLDTNSKNISIKNKLNLSINSTLKLYKECLSILNYPENIIDTSSIESISNLKNE